jgi:hypothetical protein
MGIISWKKKDVLKKVGNKAIELYIALRKVFFLY